MGGVSRFLLVMSAYVLVEVARVGSTVWLSFWTNTANNPQGAPHGAMWYLAIYAAISGIQVGARASCTCVCVRLRLRVCEHAYAHLCAWLCLCAEPLITVGVAQQFACCAWLMDVLMQGLCVCSVCLYCHHT